MRPDVVASSFSTTARCAGCSKYSRRPATSSNLAKRAWVYPPERPEKSSPTERSTVLGTSSLKPRIDETRSSTSSCEIPSRTAKNTRWSTTALPLAPCSIRRSLADDHVPSTTKYAFEPAYLMVVGAGVLRTSENSEACSREMPKVKDLRHFALSIEVPVPAVVLE